MISNSTSFLSFFLHLKFANNFISFCIRKLRTSYISILATINNLFFIRNINKVIKSITKYIR